MDMTSFTNIINLSSSEVGLAQASKQQSRFVYPEKSEHTENYHFQLIPKKADLPNGC